MTRIPSKQEVLDWISANPTLTSKRDIAKAFGIKGSDRIDLKRILKELEAEGHLEKRRKTYRDPDRLPPVSVLQVTGPDADGDLFARPLEWHGEGAEPVVLMLTRASDPALGEGDRILAKLTLVQDENHSYEARLIRRIGTNPKRVLGVFRKGSEGGRIVPVDKSGSTEWMVPEGATNGARDGELVEAEQAGPKSRMGLPRARITDRLGDPSAPKAVSLIAIHQHGIPDAFPDAVIEEADKAKPMGLGNREDLRELPLVTIDPQMPAITMMPAMPMPMTTPPTRAVMWSGSPSLMSRPMCARARRWIARRAIAATPPISPTALCRCCLTGCRATFAPCTKGCPAPVSPCGCSWMRRATRSDIGSCVA